MKNIYILISFSIILISSCTTSRYYQSDSSEYYQSQPEITYQQFYNDLSPYGNWINYGNYGYAWVPSMSNFRPYYTNGYWVYTDYGWTWVSNYNWGWAPFHYGRWMNDMRYGWVWIPGDEWAPAWVTWRGGGDYYGWAPLGPGMNIGNFGSIPYNDWTFVPRNYITSQSLNRYYVNQSRNVTIINNTTIINNSSVRNSNGTRSANYNPGPPVREVERNTGTRIRKYNLETSNKPGETKVTNSSIRVFRPTINQQAPNSSNTRPERVTNSADQERPNNSAPVREIPKNQTPQIIRDEPPVNNNRPSITPEKNNTPARVFPERNQTSPPTTRENPPVNNNPQPNNPPAQAPVRTFPNNNPAPPNNQAPATRERSAPAQENKRTPANRPVRRFSNQQNAATTNPYKQNEQKINSKPARSSEEISHQKNEVSTPSPVPNHAAPIRSANTNNTRSSNENKRIEVTREGSSRRLNL